MFSYLSGAVNEGKRFVYVVCTDNCPGSLQTRMSVWMLHVSLAGSVATQWAPTCVMSCLAPSVLQDISHPMALPQAVKVRHRLLAWNAWLADGA